ncbi:MAG: DUF5684 domain-containing protein [Lachnospiraceae bacterium]|jgi:hypothetical protein|nr:DUF5684 domain-containing protein [Lachnospiraceae bacterium]
MFVGVNWQVFKKCGEKPWKAWIPFYSNYTLNKLIIGNGWFFILSYIPFVNVIYSLYLGYRIALAFKFKTMGTILAIGFSSLTLFAVAFSDTSKYTAVQQFKLKDFKNNLIPKKIDDYFN